MNACLISFKSSFIVSLVYILQEEKKLLSSLGYFTKDAVAENKKRGVTLACSRGRKASETNTESGLYPRRNSRGKALHYRSRCIQHLHTLLFSYPSSSQPVRELRCSLDTFFCKTWVLRSCMLTPCGSRPECWALWRWKVTIPQIGAVTTMTHKRLVSHSFIPFGKQWNNKFEYLRFLNVSSDYVFRFSVLRWTL